MLVIGVVTVKLLSSLLFFYVTLKNIDQNCQLGRTVCMTTDAETCALCFIKCVSWFYNMGNCVMSLSGRTLMSLYRFLHMCRGHGILKVASFFCLESTFVKIQDL